MYPIIEIIEEKTEEKTKEQNLEYVGLMGPALKEVSGLPRKSDKSNEVFGNIWEGGSFRYREVIDKIKDGKIYTCLSYETKYGNSKMFCWVETDSVDKNGVDRETGQIYSKNPEKILIDFLLEEKQGLEKIKRIFC